MLRLSGGWWPAARPLLSRAIVLLSGGLDSATASAVALERGFKILALSFRYGQRHSRELDAAAAITKHLGVERHLVVDIDLRVFGGSALTDEIEVPKGRTKSGFLMDIPITYVPARNTIFLSYALALAEVEKANNIFIGVNSLDYSGYPDCRPEYIASFQAMANLATKSGVEGVAEIVIDAPLVNFSKAEIVELGARLGVDYSKTFSCYDPPSEVASLKHCGVCDACSLRRKGFIEAGIFDPTVYAV